MYIRVDDGIAKFATHLIHVTDCTDVSLKIPFQIEQGSIVVYSDEELQRTINMLNELNISYNVEQLNTSEDYLTKVEGIKYANRDEVIAHLLNDAEPENLIIPNLRKQLKDAQELVVQLQNDNKLLKSRLKAAEDAILGVMFKGVAK